MDRSSRSLLRRIAMGLPIAAAPFGGLLISGFTICGQCPGPEPSVVTTHAISLAQHDRLTTDAGAIDSTECVRLCIELRTADGGVADGASPDAGVTSVDDARWTCTLDRVEPDEILTCTLRGRQIGCGVGRRPQALVAAVSTGRDVGAWLAEVAHLEAASVPAFDELAIELALHGGPATLSNLARASANDERRHARVVRTLALRYGARPASVTRGHVEARSLASLAHDNAAEGCVREAFGALVAAHQAEVAADPRIRAAFAGIARDEARHALFSFELHDWAGGRLGAKQARELEERRQEELATAFTELAEPTPERRIVLGLPDQTRAAEMLALLAA